MQSSRTQDAHRIDGKSNDRKFHGRKNGHANSQWASLDMKKMSQWKIQSSTQCPQCGYAAEDKNHVIKCPHPTAHKQWEKSLTALNNWLIAQKAEPIVRTTIIQCLKAWQMEGVDTSQGLGFSTHLQDKLGWNLALDGVLTEQQRTQQELYWQWIKSRHLVQRWTAELIKKMWKLLWEMWQHCNSMLHETESGRLLIVEGNVNKQVIQVYKAGAHKLLAADVPIIHIQLASIVSKSR